PRISLPRSRGLRPGTRPSRWLFGDAVEEPLAPQIKLLVHQRGGGTEDVVEAIDGQRGVLPVVTQHNRSAIAAGDVNPSPRADRRGKDKIADAFEPQRFAARLAGLGLETGEDVLIVPQKIERVVIEQR